MSFTALTANQVIWALVGYVFVILSLSAHEWGHAFAADKLGDDTPRRMGRVTFNPLAHIDLVGTVILPLFALFSGFAVIGWAKPVMINPDNLPAKTSRSLVTIAGPAMNLVLALIGAIVLGVFWRETSPYAKYAALFVQINVNLMLFNLLPVPPLDGSKFLMYWFGMSERAYAQFARFGWFALMALFYIPQTRNFLLQLLDWTLKPFIWIANYIA